MIITLEINRFKTNILETEISTLFNNNSIISSNDKKISIHSECTILSKSLRTDGLCICELNINSSKEIISPLLKIDGEHILMYFSFSNSLEKESGRKEEVSLMSGEIKVSYQLESHNYELLTQFSNRHMVIAVMSKSYLTAISGNDPLIGNLMLFKNVLKNQAFESAPNTYDINLAITHILGKITHNRYENPLKRQFVDSKLKGLFSLLAEQEITQLEHTIIDTDKEVMKKLYQAKAILNKDYTDPPTISQLSRLVLLNEFKLKKQFKETFGLTIHNYIQKVRMEEAYAMIKNNNIMIFEAALRLGYKDTSHFIHLFKKYYGFTPKSLTKGITGNNKRIHE